MSHLNDTYFNGYEAYAENEITGVTSKGISLRNGILIDFSVCAENFKALYPQICGKCVGERDITDWSFTFYAAPKPIMIKFFPRNKFFVFFSPNNTLKRFKSLQNKLGEFGYTTYDLS